MPQKTRFLALQYTLPFIIACGAFVRLSGSNSSGPPSSSCLSTDCHPSSMVGCAVLQLEESREERRRTEHMLTILEAVNAAEGVIRRQQALEAHLSKVTSTCLPAPAGPLLIHARCQPGLTVRALSIYFGGR